jgi:type IV pilus assembly protein PilV
LISILIFSLGILAIVGLQAAAIKNAGDAKYRTDASLLASKLIAEMWASDRTQATLKTNYQTGGTSYNAWYASDMCPASAPALPGVCGVAANQPLIAISAVTVTSSPSNIVTVTLFWSAPAEPAQAHKYITVAQITK